MNDVDVLAALSEVRDPELGINIVDLGLVYRTERAADAIHVEMTTTVPSCPASDVLVQAARDVLARSFPDASTIDVRLVFEPQWSPARMSDAAREQLGWSRRTDEARHAGWLSRFTRH